MAALTSCENQEYYNMQASHCTFVMVTLSTQLEGSWLLSTTVVKFAHTIS